MLLLRLAAQNIGRRRLRALLLGVSVALAVGVAIAGLVAGLALREGIATSFSRMGADLVVVPGGALVNLTSSLLTVQPTKATLDGDVVAELAAIAGVARAAPQRIVRAAVDGRPVNLIAFDPAKDFTVVAWVRERHPGSLGVTDLVAGGSMRGAVGETLSVCRQPLEVRGRLARTGVGPLDEAYFVTFAGLEFLAAQCGRDPGMRALRDAAAAHAEHETDAVVCMPDFVPNRVSAVLLQLGPAARIEQVKFAIAQIADVKVVEGNAVVTSSRQALRTLFLAIVAFCALMALTLLILVSLLFSAIVQERRREIGLLRAMGAQPAQVVAVVLAEAALVTSLGALAGIVLGITLLLAFARSLRHWLESLGVPFGYPAVEHLALGSAAVVLAAVALGVAGALLPAWRVVRREPHALIHEGST